MNPNDSRRLLLATILVLSLTRALEGQTSLTGAQSGTLPAGVYVTTGDLTVAAASTWTLSAGVIIKLTTTHSVAVNGTLIANGVAVNPVIFTAFADDTAGGNTNGGGVSAGSPGAWEGIQFNAGSSASNLAFTEIRYGGANSVSNIEVFAGSPTFSSCTIRNCSQQAMFIDVTATPIVTNCAFVNNLYEAVSTLNLHAVAGFTNCTASGPGKNYIMAGGGIVSSNLTIGPANLMGGALVCISGINVVSGATLTLRAGSVIKFPTWVPTSVTVFGGANFLGTAYEPVVFTSEADDAFAGDTNNNGPSTGLPGSWDGISFYSGAGPSIVENVIIRYAGGNFAHAFNCLSSNVVLRSSRVDHSIFDGFVLGALAADATNLVAWSCGNDGIRLTGGSFDVIHATCASNNRGIEKLAGWTGQVINSICSSNTTSNFFGFGTGTSVSYSNGGFAGTNGNILASPSFVSLATGDLRLSASSPSIGTAEPLAALATVKDHAEYPRLLDSNLSGVITADMGAFERSPWDMDVAGVPRIGTTMLLTVTGPPGDSYFLLGALDGVLPLSPYGIVLAGAVPFVTVSPLVPFTIPVGTPVALPVPFDPSIVGLQAGLQTLTTVAGNPAIGNLTQLYRVRVRP